MAALVQWCSDSELLAALGINIGGKLIVGALLRADTEAAIRERLPGHNWTFLQMTYDTDYGVGDDRASALPLSV